MRLNLLPGLPQLLWASPEKEEKEIRRAGVVGCHNITTQSPKTSPDGRTEWQFLVKENQVTNSLKNHLKKF